MFKHTHNIVFGFGFAFSLACTATAANATTATTAGSADCSSLVTCEIYTACLPRPFDLNNRDRTA